MSNIRESFPILEDSSNVGVVITQAVPGTAASAIVSTIAAPVFQDSSGNLVFPQLTPGGAIAVDTNADVGTKAYVSASAGGSLIEVVVATLSLTAGKKIEEIEFEVSSRRGSLFRFAYNNDGSESQLGYYVVESGQYAYSEHKNHINFTAATGTQQLKMYATNFDVASDLFAYIGCVQV